LKFASKLVLLLGLLSYYLSAFIKMPESFSLPSLTKIYHKSSYPAIDPKRPEHSAKGKTIIITGGGSNSIGGSIALSFARAGAEKIAIIGRTEKTLLETKSKVEAECPSTTVLVSIADISKPESIGKAAHQVRVTFGAWDIFVHNAGYLPDAVSLAGADTDDWWKGFETNVKFPHIFAKHFLTKCRPNATFVSLSSAVLHFPASAMTGLSSYSASKLAQLKLNEYLAAENPHLRVFNVHPGSVETPMYEKHWSTRGGIDAGPARDDPALPGDFIVWLASDQAEFLRGRFVWANWDVTEMMAMKEKIEADPLFLAPTLGGWPFNNDNK
jgi:NAD(P)-dependent dehydrogenase (short-subunit alcohol dehydrogenase family)